MLEVKMTDNIQDADDIPVEVKRAIIEQQIAGYKNGRYQTQVVLRVRKSIGEDEAALKSLIDDLVKIEKLIDGLRAELAALG